MIIMERLINKPGEAKSDVQQEIPRACVDEALAVEFIEKQRWGDMPECPHCGSKEVAKMTATDGQRNKRYLWRCHECKKQFTVRVGTIMEDSRIPLRIWCWAFWSACASKKGISALQISRECNLSYKSALFLMHRIRHAMGTQEPAEKLDGIVEVDETYVGGRPRNKSKKNKRGRATKKTPVVAMVQRPGNVRTRVIPNVTAKTLSNAMYDAIDRSARLCTDEYKSYRAIGRVFEGGHGRVNHSILQYVKGIDHVNTAESFFAILKRGLYRTWHAVSKKHLPKYVGECEFRWNTRPVNDGERITAAIKAADGKRLTYYEPVKRQLD